MSPARSPSRAMSRRIARLRAPTVVDTSHLAITRSTSEEGRYRGSEANRQPAMVAIAAAAGLLVWRLRSHPATSAPTWDCGYAAPTPRIQYTARSFAEMRPSS